MPQDPSGEYWSWRITLVTSHCSCRDCIPISKWRPAFLLFADPNRTPTLETWTQTACSSARSAGCVVSVSDWGGGVYLSLWPQSLCNTLVEAGWRIDLSSFTSAASALPFSQLCFLPAWGFILASTSYTWGTLLFCSQRKDYLYFGSHLPHWLICL